MHVEKHISTASLISLEYVDASHISIVVQLHVALQLTNICGEKCALPSNEQRFFNGKRGSGTA